MKLGAAGNAPGARQIRNCAKLILHGCGKPKCGPAGLWPACDRKGPWCEHLMFAGNSSIARISAAGRRCRHRTIRPIADCAANHENRLWQARSVGGGGRDRSSHHRIPADGRRQEVEKAGARRQADERQEGDKWRQRGDTGATRGDVATKTTRRRPRSIVQPSPSSGRPGPAGREGANDARPVGESHPRQRRRHRDRSRGSRAQAPGRPDRLHPRLPAGKEHHKWAK